MKIVAVGGGFAYGSLGATHHATEDLAVMRSLPGMTVVAPGDPCEARAATESIASLAGPCYLRLGRAGEPKVHDNPIHFQLGKAITARKGDDLTLISTGGLLETAVQVSDKLLAKGMQCRVLSMHTLKPLDEEAVLAAAKETGAVFTLEEHSVLGGLGSAVAEILAESSVKPLFKRIGLPSSFSCKVGAQEYLRVQHGLSVETVEEKIYSALDKNLALAVRADL